MAGPDLAKTDLTDPRWRRARERYEWRHWLRCRVRILVVTDDGGYFDHTSMFGLGKVLDIVKSDLWPRAKFEITTAHRGTAPAAKTNFKFDREDLSEYDQIWMFGIEDNRRLDSRKGAISESELGAIAKFMDAGGGVFATGDHQKLGLDMCGEVPRVRSMRRWHFPNPGPNGEPVAPDVGSGGEYDTVTADASLTGTPSQTDKVPQVIEPKMYWRSYPGGIHRQVAKFPHPVLCGPAGPITYLPDHQHEGLVEVPADLDQVYIFDGHESAEYPTVGTAQQRPEVIARGTNFTTGQKFGVIGAYDGHRANVGRVVVDSTWHHWFNVNMSPYADASDPDLAGYDAAVAAKWEEIKAYFRNVAAWLSPPAIQRCLTNSGLVFIIGHHEIAITHQDLRDVVDPIGYYRYIGTVARDAIGRLAGQCQTNSWHVDLGLDPRLELFLDLWGPEPKEPEGPRPLPFIDLDDLTAISLGGAVHALRSKVGRNGNDAALALVDDSEAVREIAKAGAQEALAVLEEKYKESCQWFEEKADD